MKYSKYQLSIHFYHSTTKRCTLRRSRATGQCRQLKEKFKVLLDFFQKIVGFQRATPLVAFRRKRNPYALRAFLLLFAIEKEAEFEAEPHKLQNNNKQQLMGVFLF